MAIEVDRLPSLIIFDLMGTLLEVDAESDASVIERLLRQDGVDPGEGFELRYRTWRQNRPKDGSEVSLRARLIALMPISLAELERLERNFLIDHFKRSRVIDGVEEMLRYWGPLAQLGVVSNFFIAGAAHELLCRHGLRDHFSFVIGR
jgi:FMN phosphatase YigB (HAD superfamily)